ncbi:hypothetical protein OG217_37395 (plasmid) [Streptomyces sp. NBC_01023]|uniref:hypothetical protein n=1 Tax=unclassified Streptomyces TaxID=2593676 RepID=UPI002F917AFE|nr:hypothetical protein OG217_37395 [Streptomyces sp. NBC_01023]
MTDTTTETPATTERTTAAVPQQEPYVPEALGATRIAGLLGQHTGQPVTPDDVAELVAQEHLEVVDHYKGWPMYSTAAARELDTELVHAVVAERVAWEAASLARDAAAERIGWHWSDLVRMGEEGRITTGRGGRYLITDLDTMAAEADGEQYVTAKYAATDVLEIRASDWKYVEAAGWIRPAQTYEREVGRHRTVTVSLYRLGDVRALLELPGVDWEAVRGLTKGTPSPLREYAKLAPTRAAAVRAFAQGLAVRTVRRTRGCSTSSRSSTPPRPTADKACRPPTPAPATAAPPCRPPPRTSRRSSTPGSGPESREARKEGRERNGPGFPPSRAAGGERAERPGPRAPGPGRGPAAEEPAHAAPSQLPGPTDT